MNTINMDLAKAFASTCHSKQCVNGVCKESNECNVTLTNSAGGSATTSTGGNVTPSGKTLNEPTSTDLPLATEGSDPIAELIAWIQSILDSILK